MSSSATETGLVDVLLPQVGTSIAEATVVSWHQQVGDEVKADEPICEVSSEKIDVECPAPASGIVDEILVDPEETVPVGTVLARIRPAKDGPAPARQSPRNTFVSPVAGRIAKDRGIDIGEVKGTGRGGRVTKRDVLAHQPERPMHGESTYRPPKFPSEPREPQDSEQTNGSPAPVAEDPPVEDDPVVEPLSRMRRSIGEAMLRSQATTATCHTLIDCDMSAVERRRSELGLTALPLVAAATVEVLGEFPSLNANLGDEGAISRYRAVHLGIAVSLDEKGLIVPVIRDAQKLTVEELGDAIRSLAERARAGDLRPDEARGATFTITNPGGYGSLAATPVIDLPQVGILDLEAIVRRPVVVATEDGGESIGIRPMANLILGWDHRAIDGIYAARFLSALKDRLQSL